jgi:SAM-dependent methyltransferase
MRDLDLEYTFRLEQDFWWFRGMRAIAWSWLNNLQPTRLLDAGCGTGFHLGWLVQRWPAAEVHGLDLSATALRFARNRYSGSLAQGSVAALPFQESSFDLVTSFDVLSQVPQEAASQSLTEFQRVLRPGGAVLLRVAATPWLRSSHDDELQTHTRFSRAGLASLIAASGLRLERISYVNCLLFPVAAARRLLKRAGLGGGSDVRPLPASLRFAEAPFFAALNLEAAWLRRPCNSFPFGLSLHALARKSV